MASKLVGGIDEAGRGPLVGDMFVALVLIDESSIDRLKALGVRDSKKLTPEQRASLFPYIVTSSEIVIVERVSPSEIDERNLNELFVDRVCRCIYTALKRIDRSRVSAIYIDSAGDPVRTKYRIASCLHRKGIDIELVVEHGADAKYIPVGAASIVAKYLRDSHIAMLRGIYGDFGSGYPSDPKTIDWLKKYFEEHGEVPPIVRMSWSTVKRVLGIEVKKKRFRDLLSYAKR